MDTDPVGKLFSIFFERDIVINIFDVSLLKTNCLHKTKFTLIMYNAHDIFYSAQ